MWTSRTGLGGIEVVGMDRSYTGVNAETRCYASAMTQTQKSIVDVERADGVVIGRIHCPTVGEREAPIIRDEVIKEAKVSGFKLALDFTQVTMMGSLALGTLVTISKECSAGGGKLALFGLNGNLTEVLKMTRLDKLLPIYKDQATALKKLK